MATCGQMVEGNIVSFACDLDPNHEGPHRAIENDRSVRERKKWEGEQRQAESGLSEFQGQAQTTAERYTENPTPVPGREGQTHYVGDDCPDGHADVGEQLSRVEDAAEAEDRATAVVVTEDQDGTVRFKQASSAEAKVAGVPEYLAKTRPQFRRGAQGCAECRRGRHEHCQFIEDNIGAVDAEDFIDCYCDCFKASPGMHQQARETFERLGQVSDAIVAHLEDPKANPFEQRPRVFMDCSPECSQNQEHTGEPGCVLAEVTGEPSPGEMKWTFEDPEVPEEVLQPTKQREGDQPLPQPTGGEYVQDRIIEKVRTLVAQGGLDQAKADDIIARMEESKQVGIQRYGTPLQTFNGRDCLQDAVDEARDLYVYLSSMQQAREASRERLIEEAREALEAEVAQGGVPSAWEVARLCVDAILKATGGLDSDEG